ncbi:MAG TPA: hypothetical protein VHV74_12565 [Pseudonocardiaceae bacterium]|jgi:hypothetical protein|nr:hypothetical protein [Pseudonocardiaceae bacterium]
MADQSFFVHLQSLFDFADELQTQLTGMTSPVDRLTTLAGAPVLLGAFGEAQSLGTSHQAAVAEMSDLLGQVRQAFDFAEDVTKTVATGYQQADQEVAGGMRVSGVDSSSGHHSGSNDSVWATNYHGHHDIQGGSAQHGSHHAGSSGVTWT